MEVLSPKGWQLYYCTEMVDGKVVIKGEIQVKKSYWKWSSNWRKREQKMRFVLDFRYGFLSLFPNGKLSVIIITRLLLPYIFKLYGI